MSSIISTSDFALDHRPGMRMKRELDPVLERALADLVEILRENLCVSRS